MLSRLVYAIAVGILTALACLLIGAILSALGVPIVGTIGDFLTRWAWVLGAAAGLATFATGWTWRGPTP